MRDRVKARMIPRLREAAAGKMELPVTEMGKGGTILDSFYFIITCVCAFAAG